MHPQDIEIVEKLKILNIIPHNTDKILYKYASIESAIKILTSSTLLYQTPNNFNDPFDMHMGLLDLRKAAIDLFWSRAHSKYTPSQIEVLKEKITDDDCMRLAEDAMHGQREKIGVLCLSKTNRSTLMWSHYAQNHTGVCLGFRIANNFPLKGITAFEVNYASSVNPRQFTFDNEIENLVDYTYWICTKSHVWGYEDEVRVISLNQNGLIPFNKYQLCELYFGVGTPQTEVNAITELIKNYCYRLYCIGKMLIDKNTFDLKPTYYPPFITNFPSKISGRNF